MLLHTGGFNQRQGEALPPQILLTLSRFVFTVQTRKLGAVYSQENYRNCCHLMSDFKAKKAPNSMSAGAPTQIPLGELTVLPRLPADPIPALKMFFSPQSSDQRTVSALPFLWQFAWHSAMWRVQNQSIMQSRWK